MKNEKERQEHLFYTNNLYDEYLQKTEKRGASYGELAYIESLTSAELDELDTALIEELEKLEAKDEK